MRPGLNLMRSTERERNNEKRANQVSKNMKRKSGGRVRKADPVLKGIAGSQQDDGTKSNNFMDGIYNKFKTIYSGTMKSCKRILNLCTEEICFQPSDNSNPNLVRKSSEEQVISGCGLSKVPLNETTVDFSILTCQLNEVTATEQQGLNGDGQDVEEIKEDIPTIDLTDCDSYLSVTVKQEKETEDTRTHRDTINYNLLRLARQGNQEETEIKWLEDHYYFVVDTNVLLQHITFMEELKEMKLCDTNGTVFYIPNSVLEELEILKECASGDDKCSAKRAMNYLNLKFQTKDKHFQAQTGASEDDHIIQINSKEDRKINCCLQVKSRVINVALLTEDISLTERAISNGILVPSKVKLIAPPTIHTTA